ncbi:Nucleolar RNA helicase 2 [Entophlyctis luteolus]|nr:Nucleolar RNA helicase 2 [Entophlyctis luteolus]
MSKRDKTVVADDVAPRKSKTKRKRDVIDEDSVEDHATDNNAVEDSLRIEKKKKKKDKQKKHHSDDEKEVSCADSDSAIATIVESPKKKKDKKDKRDKKDKKEHDQGADQTATEAVEKAEPVETVNSSWAIDELDANDPDYLKLSSYNLSKSTIDALVNSGRKTLFPIQAACFNKAMAKKDILARARTGTGKTLAFALPIIESLKTDKQSNWNAYSKRGRAPLALVMAPTRELANQVHKEFETVAAGDLRSVVVYGGAAYENQITSLKAGVDIIVGTPGRLIDHIDRGNIKLQNLKFLVMDECDMMVDVGFSEVILQLFQRNSYYSSQSMDKVLEQTLKQKELGKTTESHPIQTFLFSATLPDWINSVISKFMKPDYETVDLVGSEALITSEQIEHLCIPSKYQGRADMLGDIVAVHGRGTNGRTIVFVETKNEANELGLNEKLVAFGTQVLHGDIQQSTREASIQGFRDGKFRCLVTTNVCARGVDIPEVDLVINCEPPADVETYVHRSGRTGRAGKSGICITFYKPNQEFLLGMISKKAGVTFKKYGAPHPKEIVKNRCYEFMDTLKSIHPEALAYFTDAAESLLAAYHNDPVLAVSAAFAVICNVTKPFPVRSLMTAADGVVTVLFKAPEKLRNPGFIKDTIKKHHPHISISVDTFGWKLLKDGTGMLVDINEEKVKVVEAGILLGGVIWSRKGGIDLTIPSILPELLDGSHSYDAKKQASLLKKGSKKIKN